MKIVHSRDAAWVDGLNKGNYGNRRKPLGGEKLSTSLWELLPGKKSFPLHSHHITEEALYVLSGTAKVRTPEGVTVISAGDYVSFPPGGPAHQLINDGTEPMTYLAMSAGQGVDVVEYPDTNKLATAVGAFPNGKRFIFRKDTQVEYFDADQDA